MAATMMDVDVMEVAAVEVPGQEHYACQEISASRGSRMPGKDVLIARDRGPGAGALPLRGTAVRRGAVAW